jgi:hypothetical protein
MNPKLHFVCVCVGGGGGVISWDRVLGSRSSVDIIINACNAGRVSAAYCHVATPLGARSRCALHELGGRLEEGEEDDAWRNWVLVLGVVQPLVALAVR